MNGPPQKPGAQTDPQSTDLENELARGEQSVRSLLKRGHVLPIRGEVDLLGGVQSRIRHRSRGKFFADGWSTGRAATSTYVLTALLMLAILAIAYFVLMPAFPSHLPK